MADNLKKTMRESKKTFGNRNLSKAAQTQAVQQAMRIAKDPSAVPGFSSQEQQARIAATQRAASGITGNYADKAAMLGAQNPGQQMQFASQISRGMQDLGTAAGAREAGLANQAAQAQQSAVQALLQMGDQQKQQRKQRTKEDVKFGVDLAQQVFSPQVEGAESLFSNMSGIFGGE